MNPTIEDKGKMFAAKIKGMDVVGRIQVEDGNIYLCQDGVSGKACSDRLGFKFSYTVGKGDDDVMRQTRVTEFRSFPGTAPEIEDYSKFCIGEELKHPAVAYKKKVMSVLDNGVVITMDLDGTEDLRITTRTRLHKRGWRLAIEPEPESVEMTIGQIAEKLGIEAHLLKVVD